MKTKKFGNLCLGLYDKIKHHPWNGQLELTFRCNLNCIHCYCKGLEAHPLQLIGRGLQKHRAAQQGKVLRDSAYFARRELTTEEWKKILDMISREGCLRINFTGGDPLLRDDFLDIYSYAAKRGFIVTIFTNGQAFTKKIINYLAKIPPQSIEITLNGISKATYETITQVEGSFSKVLENIKKIKEKKLPLILKSNCLKQNKHEIAKIKAFAEKFLAKLVGRYHFKYDPMIYPKLNGDKRPCDFRLSLPEILEVRKQDPDMWQEYKKAQHCDIPGLKRNRVFLYHCDLWMRQFLIDPYGHLKFCEFSDKFSTDLTKVSFREGFYSVFPRLLNEKFKSASKCRHCFLRPICHWCPAAAYLETGNEEAPVPYFCELAKSNYEEMRKIEKEVAVKSN